MRWPVGESLRETSTMVSCTVIVRRRKSTWRGRRAASSPQRSPVSMAVRTRTWKRSGIWARTSSNSAGVRMRVFFRTTLGSSVAAQGLKASIRSRTARAKTECSIVWYLAIDRGDRPSSTAWLTHPWTVDGLILASGMGPKYGTKWVRRFDRYPARVLTSRCREGSHPSRAYSAKVIRPAAGSIQVPSPTFISWRRVPVEPPHPLRALLRTHATGDDQAVDRAGVGQPRGRAGPVAAVD